MEQKQEVQVAGQERRGFAEGTVVETRMCPTEHAGHSGVDISSERRCEVETKREAPMCRPRTENRPSVHGIGDGSPCIDATGWNEHGTEIHVWMGKPRPTPRLWR